MIFIGVKLLLENGDHEVVRINMSNIKRLMPIDKRNVDRGTFLTDTNGDTLESPEPIYDIELRREEQVDKYLKKLSSEIYEHIKTKANEGKRKPRVSGKKTVPKRQSRNRKQAD